jgi:hypothetical protein
MEGILIFDPATEYEILETIEDFQEQITRPDELRFFTLDEQLQDFFEKSLPVGKPTTFQLKELRYDRDRIRKAYSKLITVTDTDYVLNVHRTSLDVDWIQPVYGEFKYNPYSFDKEYAPLFSSNSLKQSNYYPRLIDSLPKPFNSVSDGLPLTINSTLVNEEGLGDINALTNFTRTKKIIHDDGSMDLLNLEFPNTTDDIKIKGYFIKKRLLELPNPLDTHPFLKSNQSSFLKSDIPLLNLYPTVESIMEHAIPIMTDPYIEGQKYLKLYDIKLSQIPWNIWKSRFPPVELKQTPKKILELELPKKETKQPSEILLKSYSVPYFSGMHERLWLSKQIDGGNFVGKILVSASSSNGLVALGSPEGPSIDHPKSSIDICQNLLGDFDSFLHAGLYRTGKKNKDGIEIEDGICVPIGYIQQQKSFDLTRNKIGWKENTDSEILNNYKKLLKHFQISNTELPKLIKYDKFENLIESERRKDVLSILSDEQRSSEDKANAIELILRDLHNENKQFVDQNKAFVICEHTLSILRGQLEENTQNFLNEWSFIQLGKRVCKFCGEEISSKVLIAVEEYDESGRLVMTYESLDNNPAITNGTLDTFTNSLLKIKEHLDLTHGGENLLYLLLAVLQILPQENQLLPIIGFVRTMTKALKARKIQKDDQERIECLLGLCALITLLQVHDPFLIPRKTFGSKPLQLNGFPRDSIESGDSPIINSILNFTIKVFEELPSIRGPIQSLSKILLSKSKKVKEEIVPFLKFFHKQFIGLFDIAKERYVLPTEELLTNSIIFPFIRIDEPYFKTGDKIQDESLMLCNNKLSSTHWSLKKQPNIIQKPLKLQDKIFPSPKLQELTKLLNQKQNIQNNKKEIEHNISIGLSTGFPLLTEYFKKSTEDFSSYTILLNRLLDILSQTKFSKDIQIEIRSESLNLNTNDSPSLLRDIIKGLVFKLLNKIKNDKSSSVYMRTLNESFKSDLVFRMLFNSKEKADAEERKLRSQETNLLKSRYREMTDKQREITKLLTDIGQAEFIVNIEDREFFAKKVEEDIEKEYDELQANLDMNKPEEGYNMFRDYVENGDVPLDAMGNELQVDYGDYGDRTTRDYNDYTSQDMFADIDD